MLPRLFCRLKATCVLRDPIQVVRIRSRPSTADVRWRLDFE
jgi:hypothetical protein